MGAAGVALMLPGCNREGEILGTVEAPVETLAAQDANHDHIEATCVLGRGVEIAPAQDGGASGAGRSAKAQGIRMDRLSDPTCVGDCPFNATGDSP